MAAESNFNFEKFVEYYGSVKNVKKQINECKICGAKLSFSHLADYKNMLVQESSRCPECGHKNTKKIHIIN
jgi:DNA-directed RNA polymerase subunit RPC12/RpoP